MNLPIYVICLQRGADCLHAVRCERQSPQGYRGRAEPSWRSPARAANHGRQAPGGSGGDAMKKKKKKRDRESDERDITKCEDDM